MRVTPRQNSYAHLRIWRYHKMPAARHNTTPVNCPVCYNSISRMAHLRRHMRTHDEHKEAET
ncbi:hypothetical protein CY34DRAFT_404897 [Suillus luteus UH-Slu-Lm8-n1]|uniref:C2H2-type domain-containing protein n=1 Tax=Suillus luteus UH-Slu-Lm8-n1 TaxID=930992 RepID=A0A0D0AV00_9AGAM|nr:hypothetical protein CY34DRAFT_404897 [Suillus luteus UH-Slu-Lm8-n1]